MEETGSAGVWRNGLRIGKRVLVTGLVVSSAPLVLPPLAVISLVGFALSVPYGIYYVSYACTEKLMGKLLLNPTPSPSFEYETEEEFSDGSEVDEGDIDMEKEGIRRGVRIEQGIVEEDVGEFWDEKGGKQLEEVLGETEGIREEEEREPLIEKRDDGDVVCGREIDMEKEDAKRGVELMIEQGIVEENGNEEEFSDGGEVDEGDVVCGREIDMEKEEEEALEDTRRGVEMRIELSEQGMEKEKNFMGNDYGQGCESVEWEDETMKENGNEEDVGEFTDEKVGKPLEEEEQEQETLMEKSGVVALNKGDGSAAKSIDEMDTPIEVTTIIVKESKDHDIKHRDEEMRSKNDNLSLNADAREIADESGLYLFEYDEEGPQCNYNYALHDTPQESERSSSYMDPQSVGFVDLPTSALLPKSNHIGTTEELYSEDKIREQINTMRKLVGYNGALNATCMEELKALFVFTGVEPPASLKDPSDLVEMNLKFRFLMSIIGVNNAGIIGAEFDEDGYKKTSELSNGIIQTYELAEQCLETNYYGAKRMVEGLIPFLQLSDSPRIVNVSSSIGILKNIQNVWAKEILSDAENLTEERVDEVLSEFLNSFEEGSLESKCWPSFLSAYTVSKAALNAYTRILAKKYPSFCINSVCPGYVKTDLTRHNGILSVEEGGQSPVNLALLPNGGPSGLFFVRKQVSSF